VTVRVRVVGDATVKPSPDSRGVSVVRSYRALTVPVSSVVPTGVLTRDEASVSVLVSGAAPVLVMSR
jgi:hypothetical protein